MFKLEDYLKSLDEEFSQNRKRTQELGHLNNPELNTLLENREALIMRTKTALLESEKPDMYDLVYEHYEEKTLDIEGYIQAFLKELNG